MSLGVLDRKREMEYTQRHIAGSVCTTRIASPEELNKILKERGNQMGKRGPKPGFKRDKRVNVNELADKAVIQASKKKDLAAAARNIIEAEIDAIDTAVEGILNIVAPGILGAAPAPEKVDPVIETVSNMGDWVEPLTHKVCKVCGMTVALSGFNVLAQTCQACEDARLEGNKPAAQVAEKPDTFDWDTLAAQTKGAVLQERKQNNTISKDSLLASGKEPICEGCKRTVLDEDFRYYAGQCQECLISKTEDNTDKVMSKSDAELLEACKNTPIIMVSAAPTVEMVNHPKHYSTGNIEVIDAIEDWDLSFNLGNAVKYIARAKHKGNEMQDLENAAWYLDREIIRLGGKQ